MKLESLRKNYIRFKTRSMWIVYALSAAVIWGISYAASGRVIERGMTPLAFFFRMHCSARWRRHWRFP